MNKNRSWSLISWIAIACLVLGSCAKPEQQAKPVNLTISAGRSLKNAFLEIQELYKQEKPNVTLTYNFGLVGDLQKAIEQGANVDIFLTSNTKSMADLESKGFFVPETQQDLLGNQIVLIVPKEASGISNFKDLGGDNVKKIALTDIKKGASSKYAEQVLNFVGILDRVKPKFVFVQDSLEVIKYLESKKADAGIVYATDAIESNGIKIVAVAPKNSHPPVIYPVAILKSSKNIPEAKEFIQFLHSDRAEVVFLKYRFTVHHPSDTSK